MAKKIILIFLISLSSLSLFSQEQPETKQIFCELVGSTTLTGKVVVIIDMGQKSGLWGLNASYIVDEKGKPKKFNSMVDAMNYMGEHGWEFKQAYVVSNGASNTYHWLLTQAVAKGEDGEYYPITKKAFNNK